MNINSKRTRKAEHKRMREEYERKTNVGGMTNRELKEHERAWEDSAWLQFEANSNVFGR